MIVLDPPDMIRVGSPQSETNRGISETQHWIRIGRTYSLSSTEITVLQFKEFLTDSRVRLLYKKNPFGFSKRYVPNEDCPQISVRWIEAARFCQWLSEKEGVPQKEWCYPGILDLADGERLVLPKDFLTRKGYRLPTEAEWEFACRGGAETSRFFGDSNDLLDSFVWHLGNSGDHAHEVARLRPNDFGFFDMLGNVNEWCQDKYSQYRAPADSFLHHDSGTGRTVLETEPHVVRGGSFVSLPRDLRSADRTSSSRRSFSLGFRIARTEESKRD